jgi:hypothetical protein
MAIFPFVHHNNTAAPGKLQDIDSLRGQYRGRDLDCRRRPGRRRTGSHCQPINQITHLCDKVGVQMLQDSLSTPSTIPVLSIPARRIRCPDHLAFLTSARAYECYVEYWNGKVKEMEPRRKSGSVPYERRDGNLRNTL